FFFFFFSSRRRHTRWPRDWSSDVCSSDLIARHPQARREQPLADVADLVLDLPLLPARRRRAGGRLDQVMPAHPQEAAVELAVLRSEERRVGKEWRGRLGSWHEKNEGKKKR